MERAGEFLGPALRRMKEPQAARTWLDAAWPKLVGPTMAAHIQPSECANGVLCVLADSREWQKQAEAMNAEIRGRVNHSWGVDLVREIRVELAQRANGRPAYEVDNDHIPFIRSRTATGKP